MAELGILEQVKLPISTGGFDYDYYCSDKIKGVAGASAGAITATLLACGLSIRELYAFIRGPEIVTYYDTPDDKVLECKDLTTRQSVADLLSTTCTYLQKDSTH